MQTKVDVLEGLLRKLTVEIPADDIHKKAASQLKRVQKTAKIDGFRPGKVPAHIIQQRYGESIMRDAIDAGIQASYEDALKAESLEPAGAPLNIEVTSGLAANENLVYEVHVEVMPEIEVKGLDSMTVKKPVAEVEDKDIDKMVETLRKQAGSWVNSDTEKTEAGQRVTVTFTGKMDGEAFDGGSAENVPVILGSGQMIPDFENALIDRENGQSFEADVTFPEDYQAEELAGKTTQFEFTIEGIETLELPEVDEHLIKKFGVEDGSVEAFRASIRDNLARQLRQAVRTDIHRQVKQHLLDANQIVVPEVMVVNEKQHMAETEQLTERVQDEEVRKEIIEKQFDQPARRRVTLGLIMSELFKKMEISPDQARVDAYIDDIAATYENPEEYRDFFKQNQQHMQEAVANVLEDQLIDKLIESAKIEEVSKDFEEMMQAVQA